MNYGRRSDAHRGFRIPDAARVPFCPWAHGRSDLRDLGHRGIEAVWSREYPEGGHNGIAGQLRQHDPAYRYLRVLLQDRPTAFASLGTRRGELIGIGRTAEYVSARLRSANRGAPRFSGWREAGPDRRRSRDPDERRNTQPQERDTGTAENVGRPCKREERSGPRVRSSFTYRDTLLSAASVSEGKMN